MQLRLWEQVLWSVASGKALCGAAVPAASALTFFSTRSDCLVTCGRYSLLVWQVHVPR